MGAPDVAAREAVAALVDAKIRLEAHVEVRRKRGRLLGLGRLLSGRKRQRKEGKHVCRGVRPRGSRRIGEAEEIITEHKAESQGNGEANV